MEREMNDTKSRVISIAFKLIKAEGYDKVTINDICNAAEISKNTFYYYFKSKDDLFMNFKNIPRDVRASRFEKILEAENCFEQYWQLIEPVIDFINESGVEIVKQMYKLGFDNESETFKHPKRDDFEKIEVAIIKKAQKLKEIRNMSTPSDLVQVAFSQTLGAILIWCMHGERHKFELKEVTRAFIEAAFDVSPEIRKGKPLRLHEEKTE